MYCQHCGSPLEPGMRFCPGCGAPRGPEPSRLAWDRDSGPGPDAEPERAPDQIVIHQHIHYPDSRPVDRRPVGDPLTKSYTLWAWAALLLYILYIPGLVVNYLAWRSAVNFERETGVTPKGKGCLVWLLWVVGIGLPILFVISAMTSPTP